MREQVSPKLEVDLVLKLIGNHKRRTKVTASIYGFTVQTNTHKLRVFKNDGTKCYLCGLEGKYFVVEKEEGQDNYFLTLYGETPDGAQVEMTKDHVIPRMVIREDEGRGGYLRTCCYRCNWSKDSKLPSEEKAVIETTFETDYVRVLFTNKGWYAKRYDTERPALLSRNDVVAYLQGWAHAKSAELQNGLAALQRVSTECEKPIDVEAVFQAQASTEDEDEGRLS